MACDVHVLYDSTKPHYRIPRDHKQSLSEAMQVHIECMCCGVWCMLYLYNHGCPLFILEFGLWLCGSYFGAVQVHLTWSA